LPKLFNMRKTLSVLFALFFLVLTTNSFAQSSASQDSAKAAKKAARAQAKADKKAAADAAKSKDVTNPTTTPVSPTPPTPKTTAAKVQPVNKSADKAVGTDAKGRTIYEGPRGGRYTLSPSGNKEYIKKEK
jgi:hypothetical protein